MDCQATLYFDMVASNSYLSVSCIIAQRDEQGKKILKTPLVLKKLTVFSYLVVLSLRVRLLSRCFSLSDIVGSNLFLVRGRLDAVFFSAFDKAEEPCDIFTEGTHCLHSFFVFYNLLGI